MLWPANDVILARNAPSVFTIDILIYIFLVIFFFFRETSSWGEEKEGAMCQLSVYYSCERSVVARVFFGSFII